MQEERTTVSAALSPRFRRAIWAVLALVLAGYCLTLCYSDLIVTYGHGIYFLDCVSQGNIPGFYDYCMQRLHPEHPIIAAYLISVYFLFAIWNLPVWVLLKLGVVTDMYSPWCILWC